MRSKELIEICNNKIDDLERKVSQLTKECYSYAQTTDAARDEARRYKREAEDLHEIIKEQQAVISFLTVGTINDETIELAAVKTYRGGWKILSYHGINIMPTVNGWSDITIYSPPHDPVNVQVSQ